MQFPYSITFIPKCYFYIQIVGDYALTLVLNDNIKSKYETKNFAYTMIKAI